jgi:hypothetical protein
VSLVASFAAGASKVSARNGWWALHTGRLIATFHYAAPARCGGVEDEGASLRATKAPRMHPRVALRAPFSGGRLASVIEETSCEP